MAIKIMGDRLLVKVIEKEEEVTQSGIFIPDTIKERPTQATVIEVGEGRLLQDGTYLPTLIMVGDKIEFMPGAGMAFKHEGEDYLIMDTQYVLAVLR